MGFCGGKAIDVDKVVDKKPNTIGIRHAQACLMFLGMVFGYFLRVNISVAIVPMTAENEENSGKGNAYAWTPSIKSLVLSSFFWGYVVAQLPAGLLAKRYGAKIVLALSTLICGFVTCLHPIIITIGNWQALCAVRVIIGLTQGVVYPCTHTLLAKWVPSTERGFLGTAVYSGAQLGTTIILATSGVIFESMGWMGIFYISGGIAMIWSILFFYYGADEPAKCKPISKLEREYIESLSGSTNTGDQQLPVPWKSIFTSAPFIGLIFAQCGFSWGFYMLLTQIPLYMSEVLQFDVRSNGLLSALPYFVMWILCFVISPISDLVINRRLISVTASRKLFNSIGQWVPMVCLIALGYMTGEQKTLAIVLLTIGVGLNAASFCGYLVNFLDLSPNFAGLMMGVSNGLSNVLSLFAPITVGQIVKNEEDPAEWRIIFFITAGVYLLCNTVFIIFGKAEIQPWNEPRTANELMLRNGTLNVGFNEKSLEEKQAMEARNSTYF